MNNTKAQRQPDLVSSTAAVEVKFSLMAARDLRDALVSLAILLVEKKSLIGYLLLLDPKLSHAFLETELRGFKSALLPNIADRLKLVIAKQGDIVFGEGCILDKDRQLLNKGLNLKKGARTQLPSAGKRDEVFLVMLHQWVTGQGSMTSKWLEETVGCNYRTVSNAIEMLGHVVRRHSDRSVSLKYFPEQDWGRILAVMQKVRSTMLYTDVSGQPRSPESLMKRLNKMGLNDVAVGGVLGAKRYYEDLDIVGTPRLDLCIHCPDGRFDSEFIRKLDPALELTCDLHRPVQVALHFVRRRDSLFESEEGGAIWADPVECLLDLYSARLDLQARSFQDFLAMRGRELNG